MTLQWHGEEAKKLIRERAAKGLIRAAIHFQSVHTQALSRSYPPASKVGEYPRARTFNLRSSVLYEPTSVGEVAKTLTVKMGLAQRAFYGVILELKRRRKGLVATLKKTRATLRRLVRGT